jgi:hypothetical protein
MLGVSRTLRFARPVGFAIGLVVALLLGSELPAGAGWQLAWSDEFNAAAWTA